MVVAATLLLQTKFSLTVLPVSRSCPILRRSCEHMPYLCMCRHTKSCPTWISTWDLLWNISSKPFIGWEFLCLRDIQQKHCSASCRVCWTLLVAVKACENRCIYWRREEYDRASQWSWYSHPERMRSWRDSGVVWTVSTWSCNAGSIFQRTWWEFLSDCNHADWKLLTIADFDFRNLIYFCQSC